MRKIPTIFKRDFTKANAPIINQWHQDCDWVRNGEGVATRKRDGTSCMIQAGNYFKRREYKKGEKPSPLFIEAGRDSETGKVNGWLPVEEQTPGDQWHREAMGKMPGNPADGTYELVGPRVNGNREQLIEHVLMRHGEERYQDSRTSPSGVPREWEAIMLWLSTNVVEGIVWHHPDGRMGKIKRRDFGLAW